MNRSRLGVRIAIALAFTMQAFGAAPNLVPNRWEQSVAELAGQAAAILGPGQARLTIRNLSTVSTDEIPVIRKLLVQDLKAHGIGIAGAESANCIRVTLSESARERLLVAEVGEGNQTQVVMIDLGPVGARVAAAQERIELRREIYLSQADLAADSPHGADDPVMAVMENGADLFVLRANDVMVLPAKGRMGTETPVLLSLDLKRPISADPRGVLMAASSGDGFVALTSGTECSGSHDASSGEDQGWTVRCHGSDEPWPIATSAGAVSTAPLKAFFNSARDYFTGVVSPSLNVELPPFYTAAPMLLPNATAGMLIGGIDSKVRLVENDALVPVAGTRDWGSDFAVMQAGCGSESQIVASGSGDAANDSLRAYELVSHEADPASEPLAVDGTVTALWPAPDGKSVLAVIRHAPNQYEVDRVSAFCN